MQQILKNDFIRDSTITLSETDARHFSLVILQPILTTKSEIYLLRKAVAQLVRAPLR